MNYPGGKGKTFQHLINMMPPHNVYIETHLGGGAVLRHKKLAGRTIGIERDPAVIKLWQDQVPSGCELVESDAVEFLSSFSFTGEELVYADPPYVSSSRRRSRVYRYDYSVEQHEALLALLKRLPCNVMISGYQNALYEDSLKDWRMEQFTSKTHVDVREECVWMNFEPPSVLHDARYLGKTYRQRQSIKRKHQRLRRRIEAMDPVEQSELVTWILETYPTEKKGANVVCRE